MKFIRSIKYYWRNFIILCGLLVTIIMPRIISGYISYEDAKNNELEGLLPQAAIDYEAAKHKLWWKDDLPEKAAQLYFELNEFGKSEKLLLNEEKKGKLNSDGLLVLGEIKFMQNDLTGAITRWGKIKKEDSNYLFGLEKLASVHRLQGDLQKAIVEWTEFISLKPDDPQAHFSLGLLIMTRNPMAASGELNKAFLLDPDLEKGKEILREYLARASLHDNRAYSLILSGQALAQIDEWDLAEAAFGNAIVSNPIFPEAWAWLGEAQQHNNKDGLPALLKSIQLNPNSTMNQALIGLYYRRNNLIDQAWSAYKQAEALEPDNSAWKIALGDLSALQGEVLTAREYYGAATSLAPEDPVSWKALALFSIQYNVEVETIGARAAYKIIKLAPGDWESQDIMGQVMQALDHLESAGKYYLKAIELSPMIADPHLHLGYLYLMQNYRGKAYDQLIIARDLNTASSVGMQAGRLLEQYFP